MSDDKFYAAAIEILKWVGLLNNEGELDFNWFVKKQPGNSFSNLRSNRDSLNNIIHYLNNKKADKIFGEYYWMPFFDGGYKLGLAWKNKDTEEPKDKDSEYPLSIGLVGELKFSGEIALSFFCGLLQISKKDSLEVAPGDTFFSGKIPVPQFLDSCQLSGMPISWSDNTLPSNEDTPPNEDTPLFSVNIKDKKNTNKELKFPSDYLAWDVIRLTVFILCSWIKNKSNNNEAIKRIRDHFIPMLGDNSNDNPIKESPFFQALGLEPSFGTWVDSIFSTGDNFAGPVTFLYHLRALLTGVESRDYHKGSFYFRLDKESTTNATSKSYPPNPDEASYWIAIENKNNNNFKLMFVIRHKNNGAITEDKLILMEKLGNNTFSIPPVSKVNNFIKAAESINAIDSLLKCHIDKEKNEINILNINLPESILENDTLSSFFIKLSLADNKRIGYVVGLTNPDIEFIFSYDGDFIVKIMDISVNITKAIEGDDKNNKQLIAAFFKLIAIFSVNKNINANPLIANIGCFLAEIFIYKKNINKAIYLELFNAILKPTEQETSKENISIPIGSTTNAPLTLGLNNAGDISVDLNLKKILDGFGASFPIKMGGLSVKQKIPITNTNTSGTTTITISDLRLGNIANTKGGNNFASKLFPNMKDIPGFGLVIDMNNGGITNLSGGGKIPIQEKVGPVSINALIVNVDKNRMNLGLDSYFLLGPITVVPYGLGINIDLSENKITQKLDGLAISMNTGGIILEGLLVDNKGDFIGGASISLFGLNGISAFGGYSEIENEASLFIFAALNAPLGGPPWCFVTGIAGGFGYNRKKPEGSINNHIFMSVLDGRLEVKKLNQESLNKLMERFEPSDGEYWMAAGIKFRSFGFIEGKLIATVNLGSVFSIGILGEAAFSVAPVAKFGLVFAATASSDQFILTAGVSPDSYIFYPDFARLTGQFGMGVWYGESSQAGDFFFSIGGFHPGLEKPAHYPSLERVGISAQLYGWVNVKGEAFFACTPKNLAMGGRLSISAGFEGVSAGFDAYVDVVAIYDPFFLAAVAGVCVWFDFCGRHELSVTLKLWTPPFGGIATVSLDCLFFDIEFDINFGTSLKEGDALTVGDFFKKYLGVAVAGSTALTFTTNKDNLGLLSVDVIKGKIKPRGDSVPAIIGQEGVSEPILVNPEFTLVVRTRLPLRPIQADIVSPDPDNKPFNFISEKSTNIHLPLCKENFTSELSITLPATLTTAPQTSVLSNKFPAALFCEKNSAENTVTATEGIKLDFVPKFVPEAAKDWHMSELEETSDCSDITSPDSECYPIPLSDIAITHWGDTRPTGNPPAIKRRVVTRSAVSKVKTVTASLPIPVIPPTLKFTPQEYTAEVLRPAKTQLVGSTITRTGITRIPVPISPQRHPAMLAVTLNIVTPKPATPTAPTPSRQIPATSILRSIFRAKPILRSLPDIVLQQVQRPGQPLPNKKASVMVGAGKAVNLVLNPKQPSSGTLQVKAADASQWTRIICLTAYAKPSGDFYVQGTTSFPVPPRTRRIVMIGEGNIAPVGRGAVALSRTIGVEMDSVLVGLGHDSFAAYGCIMEALRGYREKVEALDSVPAQDVLRATRQFRFSFPALPSGCSLILKYAAPVGDNTPVNTALHWQATNASLGQAQTLNGRQGQAVVLDITSGQQPWQLAITINRPGWRLEGVACMNLTAQTAISRLNHTLTWDLIDDSWWSETTTVTEVSVEVQK